MGGRVTLGLEHAKVSCPGSPGMGRDPEFSGKGNTAELTLATSHHLPLGITLPTNFSCKRQGCDRTGKTNRRRVRPRRSGSCGGPPGVTLTWQLLGGARATALREAVTGCAGVRAVLFPPPEGVSRATPTSRLCTLHHNRADVTEKLSPPPSKTQGREPGRGCRPSCDFSLHPMAISGGNLYTEVRDGVKRFLVCHVGKRRPNCEIRLKIKLGPPREESEGP